MRSTRRSKNEFGVEVDPDLDVRLALGSAPEIDDGPSATELRLEFDFDVAQARLDEARPDHVCDRDGVVDGRSVPAVGPAVVAAEEVVQLGDEDPDLPRAPQSLRHCGAEDGLVRDVEADHRHVQPAREHALRGLGVRPHVELRRGSHVALGNRAAHDDDALEALAPGRVEEARDVGERAGRHEGHGLLGRADLLGEEGDRIVRDRGRARCRQRRPVQAAVAVDVRRDDALADERRGCSGRDRHVVATNELEHADRVRGRLLERLVPVGRRDAEQLELGACEREEKCDRIVVARIAVEQDRERLHAGSIVGAWRAHARRSVSSRCPCPTRPRSTPGARTS